MSIFLGIIAIVVSFILWLISLSLKLIAGGVELSGKVTSRALSKKGDSELINNSKDIVSGTSKAVTIISAKILLFFSKITNILSKLIGCFGSLASLVILIIFLVLLSSASGFLILLSNNEDINWVGSDITESSSSSTSNSIANKPDGLSAASWNSADDVGKKVCKVACNVFYNHPEGQWLVYDQGDTGPGVADCVVFVCGCVQEALHKTVTGEDTDMGYDFYVNRKSDLKMVGSTAVIRQAIENRPEAALGNFGSVADQARPGDILYSSNHVLIYVGVNDSGTPVVAHASDWESSCYANVNLTEGGNLPCGFSSAEWYYDRDVTLVRTSVLVGMN